MSASSAAQPDSDSTAAQPASMSQATLASAAQPAAVTSTGSTVASSSSGVLHIDESSQLQGELNHATVIRTNYARESKNSLNRNNYSGPRERYGQIGILWYSQDHVQLPPIGTTILAHVGRDEAT